MNQIFSQFLAIKGHLQIDHIGVCNVSFCPYLVYMCNYTQALDEAPKPHTNQTYTYN